jgi:hypothetical protein
MVRDIMTIATTRAAPGLAVQLAVDDYAERVVCAPLDLLPGLPDEALSHLREAAELLAAAVPNAGRHAYERAAIDEFLTRLALKLGDHERAGAVLRHAQAQIDREFPTRN